MSSSAEVVLGAEAVAWGAIDAGIAGAFSYAGTPATEILETVHLIAPHLWSHWSANEKCAYEEALGMSYMGKRALISMKHVGLNVAADPFMSSALTGVNGGMVLAVADDPGMHSSQNEQDSRFYAGFAKIPCFEPSSQQECYDMTREAFSLSEKVGLPVMLRLVTRLAHSRANVFRRPDDETGRQDHEFPLPDPNDWTLVPANARRKFKLLLGIQRTLQIASEESRFNSLTLAGSRGIVCSGTGLNYVHEVLGPKPEDSLLKIGQYPIPAALMRQLFDHCDEIVFIEEGYPVIEEHARGLFGAPGKAIHGKLDGTLSIDGELLPSSVAQALGVTIDHPTPADSIVVPRPPQFCKGCPHSASFSAIIDSVAEYPAARLFSDIGCYSLGIMPPYRAVHSVVDMGASIGMAHGASRAGAWPVICTIGDSTFAHSGMSGLLGAAHTDANITVVILDNATTAMTGAQDSMATGEDLVEIVRGLGVKDVHVFEPLPKHHAENVALLKAAVAHKGLSVVIARRACVRIKLNNSNLTPIPTAHQE